MTAHSLQYRGLNIRFEQGDLTTRNDEAVAFSCDTGFLLNSALCQAFVTLAGSQLRVHALSRIAQFPQYNFNSPIAICVPATGQLQTRNLILLPINSNFRNLMTNVFQQMFRAAIQSGFRTLVFPPIGTGGYHLVNHFECSQAIFDALKSLPDFGGLTTITLINISAYWVEQYFDAFSGVIESNQQPATSNQPILVDPVLNDARIIPFNTTFCTLKFDEVKERYEKRQSEQESENSNGNISGNDDRLEPCSICLFDMLVDIGDYSEDDDDKAIVQLNKCSHLFHRSCIVKWFGRKPNCPVCGVCCMNINGIQPTNGTMSFHVSHGDLDGFPGDGHIGIEYNFPDGIQSDEHPNPGVYYTGTFRTCYLPNNAEGRVVKELLQIAFNRRLIFTVGDSLTTGRQNTVIWNGIHHKTNRSGGPVRFGFPDPTYFQRVKEELAAFGITETLLN